MAKYKHTEEIMLRSSKQSITLDTPDPVEGMELSRMTIVARQLHANVLSCTEGKTPSNL